MGSIRGTHEPYMSTLATTTCLVGNRAYNGNVYAVNRVKSHPELSCKFDSLVALARLKS